MKHAARLMMLLFTALFCLALYYLPDIFSLLENVYGEFDLNVLNVFLLILLAAICIATVYYGSKFTYILSEDVYPSESNLRYFVEVFIICLGVTYYILHSIMGGYLENLFGWILIYSFLGTLVFWVKTTPKEKYYSEKIGKKICKITGIVLIILQVISYMGMEYSGYSIGINYSEPSFEIIILNIISYLIYFSVGIIGLCLIILPKIHGKKDHQDQVYNKPLER